MVYFKNRYKTTRDGIPGNDDSGSMSAWYAFHSIGFYPNAGQTHILFQALYLIQLLYILKMVKT